MSGQSGIFRLVGVDFSGACRPACSIWIAELSRAPAGLQLEACFSLAERVGKQSERSACYRWLREYLSRLAGAAIGLDVPFSLPAPLIPTPTWEAMLAWFSERFVSPEHFLDYSRQAGGPRELKRETDRLAEAPMAPANLRLYRQTFYGIRQILAPLVNSQAVVVLPFQRPVPGKPWLLEVCPACYLKRRRLNRPYKGSGEGFRRGRAHLLEALCRTELLQIEEALQEKIKACAGGHALDAVLGALSVEQALRMGLERSRSGPPTPLLEGWIFV